MRVSYAYMEDERVLARGGRWGRTCVERNTGIGKSVGMGGREYRMVVYRVPAGGGGSVNGASPCRTQTEREELDEGISEGRHTDGGQHT